MRFKGKHGIVHEVTITDTHPASGSSKPAARNCPASMLFQYINGDGEPNPITSGDVNDYITRGDGRRLHGQAFPHLERERHWRSIRC